MATKANIEEHKNVWVFAEQNNGKLAKVSLEMLGEGKKLANKLGVELIAFLIGDNVKTSAETLIAYGADKVYLAEDPELKDYRTELYTDIICNKANEEKPEILIIGASAIGRDLTPRVSFRLNTGCTADCTELDIDEEKRLLISTRPAFGGNVMATIICPDHRPQMSTVRPGVMAVPEADASRKGEIINIPVEIKADQIKVRILESIEKEHEGDKIEDAAKVIGMGIGASDPESVEYIKELAKLLDAKIGGSRPCVEKHLIDHEVQVGQTGKNIRPELYIPCGISGTVQHTTGITNAKYTIAINKDPNAEIFKFANLGIAGDAKVILPAIIKEIQKYKA
ncbi:MAG: electron transfer flavoprotein subunit alpha/FixB family protein [Desulforegulaceae bacterium]|nr:electron transfer flavoprotein subunit alpha/FixB family protein [Desulforegulaceae bacterium]